MKLEGGCFSQCERHLLDATEASFLRPCDPLRQPYAQFHPVHAVMLVLNVLLMLLSSCPHPCPAHAFVPLTCACSCSCLSASLLYLLTYLHLVLYAPSVFNTLVAKGVDCLPHIHAHAHAHTHMHTLARMFACFCFRVSLFALLVRK